MKKKMFSVFLIVCALILTGCSSTTVKSDEDSAASPLATKEGLSLLSLPLTLEFETGLQVQYSSISDEDYKKYNDIMDYLSSATDMVEEDELLIELEDVYGESAEELSQFLSDKMLAAIQRDVGDGLIEENDVIKITRAFFEENFQAETENHIIDITVFPMKKANATVTFDANSSSHEALIKFEFNDDITIATVYQFKLDGRNIDLD